MRQKIAIIFAIGAFFIVLSTSFVHADTFDSWDKNKDNVLSRDELPQRIRANFDRADTNNDGKITRKEDKAFRLKIAKKAKEKLAKSTDAILLEKDIYYAGNKNPRQTLNLILPKNKKGDKKLPLLVYIHGGGWQAGDKERGAGHLGRYVASGEYAAASINYRLTNEARWPSQLDDCKAAIRWLKKNAAKYGYDPEKIGVLGHSAGGHLVAMLGVTCGQKEGNVGVPAGKGENGLAINGDVTCVVDYFGPTHFIAEDAKEPSKEVVAAQATKKLQGPVEKLLGGPAAVMVKAAKDASPLYYVTQDSQPVLIFQGTEDRLVKLYQSVNFYEKYKKLGAQAWLTRVVGAGHGCRHKDIEKREKQFLDLHLRGIPSKISEEPINVKK